MKQVRLVVAAMVSVTFASASLSATPSAKDIWKGVLRKCTASDLTGRVMYFGPSNDVGPGAIWRKAGSGYGLRATLDRIEPDSAKRTALIKEGAFASCEGDSTTTLKAGAKAALQSLTSPIEASISADFNKAKEVSVRVGSWRSDRIQEIAYEENLRLRPAEDPFKRDLKKSARRVETVAIMVKGFEAELVFETALGASLKGKYDGKKVSIGGVEASISFLAEGKMKITSDGTFYVAGELRRWKNGAVAAETIGIDMDEAGLEKGVDTVKSTSLHLELIRQ